MFRLQYLQLNKHPQLGSVEFNFIDTNESNFTNKPYTSIIIGSNGTGKSFILKTIADIFRKFENLKNNSGVNLNLAYSFHLIYKFNNSTFEIVTDNLITYDKEGKRYNYSYFKGRPIPTSFAKPLKERFENSNPDYRIDISDLILPSKILVSSVMLNDRFTFSENTPEDFYQYLGIRKTASSSSTRAFSHKTIKYLFDASKTKQFLNGLKDILEFLGFEQHFKIQYSTRYNKLFFSDNLDIKEFTKFFKEWWLSDFTKREKESIPYSASHFNYLEKDKPERIIELIKYLNYLSRHQSKIIRKPNSSAKVLELNLFQNEPTTVFEFFNKDNEYEYIDDLVKLDIINLNGIKIRKAQSELSIDQTSSGEYHLIISLLAIYARVQKSSLILIDEPEISLHPNWQMKYVSFLKQMFNEYNSCHFIITSHSPFVISDLENKSSSVIAISRRKHPNSLETELLEKNTYGWSTEEVLLKVFKTASDRNFFLAEKLGNVLELMSKAGNSEQDLVEKEISKLKEIDFSGLTDEDPLKAVVTKIFNKI